MKTKVCAAQGFTLIELMVLIFVFGILLVEVLPVFGRVSEKSAGTKALERAKQIALACKLFAGDYEGHFPSNLLDADDKVTSTPPSSANDALAQLIPDYLPDKKMFWLAQDEAYCNDSPPEDNDRKLRAGQNHWGYVINLTEKSDPRFPLVADGAAPGGTNYSRIVGTAGGTWGRWPVAIVVRVDGSGAFERLNKTTLIVPGPSADIPNLLQGGQKNWLGANNWFLNPILKGK